MINKPSKSQNIPSYCPKVMARRNLCPLNGRPRVSTNSNYHNFCKKTPNSTCKHNLESSHHKEQFAKISISKEFCSASYMQSKFCLLLPLLPLLWTPFSKNSRILPISPNPKFPPIKGGGGAQMPMLPFEAPFKGTSLPFSYSHLSNHLNPLLVLIKTKHKLYVSSKTNWN